MEYKNLIKYLKEQNITEDDALEILDNNMENLQIMGFENKFDAMRSVYDITDQFHKDINGGVE